MIPIFPSSDAVGAPNDPGGHPMPDTLTDRPRPAGWKVALIDLAEKTAATWLEAFIVALLGSTFFDAVDLSILAVAAVAAIPAAITLLANASGSFNAPTSWPPVAQGAFRVLRTWVATFLGFLASAAWVLDLSEMRAVLAAAVGAAGAALLAALKAELATFVGNRSTTAMLPARLDQQSDTTRGYFDLPSSVQ